MLGLSQELLQQGADIKRGCDYSIPFDIACWNGNIELAKVLLGNVVDINSEGEDAYGSF